MALLRNVTARISDASYRTLVEKSRNLTGLQEPLVRRPDLPPQLATSMCEWVSDALKTFIKTNYQMPPKAVEAALSGAVRMVKINDHKDTPADSAKKLIDKLAGSGQLKTGFLMRVLSQGQVDLFDLAFSRLLDVQLTGFRTAFYGGGAHAVALSCRAVGIDRAVFATVFNLSRQALGMSAALTGADVATANLVFAGFSRQSALDELRGVMVST
jgi:hypothetical protein